MIDKILLGKGKYIIIPQQVVDSVKIFYLDNGLKVIHYSKPSNSLLLSISFRAGLFTENLKNVGISHFLEHIMFNSTQNRKREVIAEEIENLGGFLNGATYDFGTTYYIKIATPYFELACDILSDMMINPSFNEDEIELERNVIINEIKNDYDEEFSYMHNLMRAEFFDDTVYQFTQAGTIENVKKITCEELKNYYNAQYCASNGFIIVIGDISQDSLKKNLNKYFNGLKKGSISNRIPIAETYPLERSKEIERHENRNQAHILISYKTPSPIDNEQFGLRIIKNILYKGLSGRIVKAIRMEEGLAYSIDVINDNISLKGVFLIYIILEKKNIEKSKKIILNEIDKLFGNNEEGITVKEFDHSIKSLLGRRALKYEYSEGIFQDLFIAESFQDYSFFSDFENNLKDVSLPKIIELLKKYFMNNLYILLD